jgi:hypothetical protein
MRNKVEETQERSAVTQFWLVFIFSFSFKKETENLFISKCFWWWCYISAIYYLDFIHGPYVSQPLRFEGWLFPRHQVYLLC